MGISLDKRTETAGISLVKQMQKAADAGIDLGEVSARVVLVMDHSGSMYGMYANGMVQDTVERCLALSLTGLDDDGDIQVLWFDNVVAREDEVNINTYQGYVQKNWNSARMGGTEYAPALDKVMGMVNTGKKGLFRKSAGGPEIPVFVLFVTDGAPSDPRATEQLLRATSERAVFVQFIAVGNDTSAQRYLEKLNNLDGRKFDNTGLTIVNNVASLPDEAFFDEILGEFVTEWLPQAKARGVAL